MKIFLFYTATLFLFLGCQKAEMSVPPNADDTAPGKVSNVKVENIPGGATLTYTLPDSKSLLYVLAEYSIRSGETLTKKASYYEKKITLEGFPNTEAHDVTLYAVSRGNKKSDPVSIKVNPLTPPVISIFKSLDLRPTFGGVNVAFLNKVGANIKINVLTPDSLGDLTTADIFYTSNDSGNFSVRGYDSVPRKFGVFVRDRWNNYSDTVFQDITPYYERQLDKSRFVAVHLPGDTWQNHTGFKSEEAVWDGLETVQASAFQTAPGSGMPQSFTIDLGVQSVLSRFKFFHKMNGAAYVGGDPKNFEIWGSNNPSQDGGWANWHLLGTFRNNPPSGTLPATAADQEYAATTGTDYEFPIGNESYRYIRFKTLNTWGGVDYIYIGELTFFGQ